MVTDDTKDPNYSVFISPCRPITVFQSPAGLVSRQLIMLMQLRVTGSTRKSNLSWAILCIYIYHSPSTTHPNKIKKWRKSPMLLYSNYCVLLSWRFHFFLNFRYVVHELWFIPQANIDFHIDKTQKVSWILKNCNSLYMVGRKCNKSRKRDNLNLVTNVIKWFFAIFVNMRE